MRGLDAIQARIREIQARTAEAPIPSHFKALLDARMAQGKAAGGPQSAAGHEGDDHGALTVASAPFAPASMTIGGMLGTQPAAIEMAYRGIVGADDLATYLETRNIESRNGRLTDSDLVPVTGGWKGRPSKLLPPAAEAWEHMRAAASAQGVELQLIDAYRTWETQDWAHKAFLRGEKTANVLPAGTSEHGNGLAIDLTNGHLLGRNDAEWHWLQDNARHYGWYPISNETWHWEFRGLNAS